MQQGQDYESCLQHHIPGPFSHCPEVLEFHHSIAMVAAPGFTWGLSLPFTWLYLFPWEKTGLNVEASEDSGELGGRKK